MINNLRGRDWLLPIKNSNFGPVTIALMTSAFEAAWHEAQVRGLAQVAAGTARDLMVATILQAVEDGERVPVRLKGLALKASIVDLELAQTDRDGSHRTNSGWTFVRIKGRQVDPATCRCLGVADRLDYSARL